MNMKHAFLLAWVLFLTACALPDTVVKTGSPRPQLAIKGAPIDSVLIVDGLSMGASSQYDGNPKVLIVEEGVHQIDIQQAGKAIHSEKVFISNGETKTIHVNGGGQ